MTFYPRRKGIGVFGFCALALSLAEGKIDGILNYCDKKVSLGFIESANLKARNVIRMAYGYRDKDYMKLKIIQACNPWMKEFNPWITLHNNSS